jgi:uncharacterized protein
MMPMFNAYCRTKDARNAHCQGVTFEAARLAFEDPCAVAREDRRQRYCEERYLLLGMVQDRLLAVAYALRGARVRIISARMAEPQERQRYHEENS